MLFCGKITKKKTIVERKTQNILHVNMYINFYESEVFGQHLLPATSGASCTKTCVEFILKPSFNSRSSGV